MSVYSTVPNSQIFLKQQATQHGDHQQQSEHDKLQKNISDDNFDPFASPILNREVHIALTPPNTPTHGIIISTCETPDENQSTCDIDKNLIKNSIIIDNDNGVDLFSNIHMQPKSFILMTNSDSASPALSTPQSEINRSRCDTPDSTILLNDNGFMAGGDHIAQLGPGTRTVGPKWNELDSKGKLKQFCFIITKIISLILLLYTFICSLDLLSTAFKLLGARVIGNFFQNNQLLQNPVVGLMIGVLVTVLVQSSSTSTSIAVTMVASRIIAVRQAVPIMMGANIGTSVTNTIVSLMQSADRREFGRAFAAATVHDMFNWLTVIVLLPLEVMTRYLESITTFILDSTSQGLHQDKTANRQFLNHLTKPLTELIIKIDTKLVEEMATSNSSDLNSLINQSKRHILIRCHLNEKCSFFGWLSFADTPTGLILLILSITILCLCLMILVKLLNSMLTGQISKLIQRSMNRQYAFPYSLVADYLAILVGCILTILVQSSSIFTSALTPLAGIGVISLERIYPLTLGANIGTTTTGILAALAADANRLRDTMQIALCHLFFNITGILLFYPLPFMRWPIPLARMLGQITANYRWFSIAYLLLMFFLLPLIVFSLSTLGPAAIGIVGFPLAIILATVILINILQRHHRHWLPSQLHSWHFLPIWMRSLDPLDRFISRASERLGCGQCCANSTSGPANLMDGVKLGHSDTHHSRLNILGAMYKSNSEAHLVASSQNIPLTTTTTNRRFLNRNQETPSVNDTIKKVISKLTKVNQQQQQDRRFNQKSGMGNYENSWSLFNSHTVHTGSQVDKYYQQPFGRKPNTEEWVADWVNTFSTNSTQKESSINSQSENIENKSIIVSQDPLSSVAIDMNNTIEHPLQQHPSSELQNIALNDDQSASNQVTPSTPLIGLMPTIDETNIL